MNSYPRNNSQTIQVKFTRYGNEAEVPLEYLKPRSAASAGAAGQRPPKRPAPEGSSQVGDGWFRCRHEGWFCSLGLTGAQNPNQINHGNR